MFTTIDFKPRDRGKITLFANTAEAVVFWLSLGGLVFLGIITLFRYFTAERTAQDYSTLVARQAELSTAWESRSSLMNAQIDSLKIELAKSRLEIARLNDALNQSGRRAEFPSSSPIPSSAKPTPPERRNRAFLEAFKVEKPQ